jgi:hypothetical protein
MKYEEFVNFVETECAHEAIYEDSDGREILVIRTLDAFHMLNRATGRLKPHGWRGLTDEERTALLPVAVTHSTLEFGKSIEEKLREKNA